MFCANCGTRQESGEKFCPNCGTKFEVTTEAEESKDSKAKTKKTKTKKIEKVKTEEAKVEKAKTEKTKADKDPKRFIPLLEKIKAEMAFLNDTKYYNEKDYKGIYYSKEEKEDIAKLRLAIRYEFGLGCPVDAESAEIIYASMKNSNPNPNNFEIYCDDDSGIIGSSGFNNSFIYDGIDKYMWPKSYYDLITNPDKYIYKKIAPDARTIKFRYIIKVRPEEELSELMDAIHFYVWKLWRYKEMHTSLSWPTPDRLFVVEGAFKETNANKKVTKEAKERFLKICELSKKLSITE